MPAENDSTAHVLPCGQPRAGTLPKLPSQTSNQPLAFVFMDGVFDPKVALLGIAIEEPQGRQVGFISLHIGENGVVPLPLQGEKLQDQRGKGALNGCFVGFGFVDDLLRLRVFVLETLAQAIGQLGAARVAVERADMGNVLLGDVRHFAPPPVLGSQTRKPFLVLGLAPQLQGALREALQAIASKNWHLTQKPVDFWLGMDLKPAFVLHQLLLAPQCHLTGFFGAGCPRGARVQKTLKGFVLNLTTMD